MLSALTEGRVRAGHVSVCRAGPTRRRPLSPTEMNAFRVRLRRCYAMPSATLDTTTTTTTTTATSKAAARTREPGHSRSRSPHVTR